MLGRKDGAHQENARKMRFLHQPHVFQLALFVVFGVAEDSQIARLAQYGGNALDQVAHGIRIDLGENDADAVGALLTQ